MNRGNILALRDKLGRKSNKLLLSVAQVLITMLDHPTHQQVQLDSSVQREYPLWRLGEFLFLIFSVPIYRSALLRIRLFNTYRVCMVRFGVGAGGEIRCVSRN